MKARHAGDQAARPPPSVASQLDASGIWWEKGALSLGWLFSAVRIQSLAVVGAERASMRSTWGWALWPWPPHAHRIGRTC